MTETLIYLLLLVAIFGWGYTVGHRAGEADAVKELANSQSWLKED